LSRQFRLPLISPQTFERAHFAVSPTNGEAVARLDAWPGWAEGRLALVGPAGTGKTHLARSWAQQADAVVVEAADPDAAPLDLPSLRGRAVLVEDADRRAQGSALDDEALFHLINMAGVDGGSLLMTARLAPVAWDSAVPDLRSRLNALPVARIEAPDDIVLEAVLRRAFAARAITPAPDVYPYLLRRIPRSALEAIAVVELLDEAAAAQGRPVNRLLAGQVLDLSDPELDFGEDG